MTSRIFVLLTLIALGACSKPEKFDLVIATGSEAGTNHALGAALAEVVTRDVEGMTARAETSAGSVENMRRLEAGDAQLAIVQNDTAGNSKIRTVAVLFEELLHVFVRRGIEDEVKDLADLRGHRVAIGPVGSGTAAVANQILDHFDVGENTVQRVNLGLAEGIAALKKGEVDALVVLAAAPFAEAEKLLGEDHAFLMPLGDINVAGSRLDGIRSANPYLTRSVIPAATYGERPLAPVGTVSVRALLAAHVDLDEEAVKRLTAHLFASKVELAESHSVAAFLDERFDAASVRFPIHAGASRYYLRDEPGFFVEYAEAISLGLTLLVGLGSGLLAFREWLKHRKKNRIDVYYGELREISKRAETASKAEISELLAAIQDVRRRAFDELIRERLEADASFLILQNFLLAEVQALEARK
jgi:uncharacterized protein